jgi:hypothetical protein
MTATYSNNTWGTVTSVNGIRKSHETTREESAPSTEYTVAPIREGVWDCTREGWDVATIFAKDEPTWPIVFSRQVPSAWDAAVQAGTINPSDYPDILEPEEVRDARLELLRDAKRDQLQATWDAAAKAGITVGGIIVAFSNDKIALLKLDAAAAMADMVGSTSVYDTKGKRHTLTNSEFLGHAVTLQTALAAKTAAWDAAIDAVDAATTEIEIDAITLKLQ